MKILKHLMYLHTSRRDLKFRRVGVELILTAVANIETI